MNLFYFFLAEVDYMSSYGGLFYAVLFFDYISWRLLYLHIIIMCQYEVIRQRLCQRK